MQALWSEERRIVTWRRLWTELARAEMALGAPVTAEQVAELEAHIADIDWQLAEQAERRLRHDVMAHIHAYAACCPRAAPIIHLGATSCFVTDNADLILMREGLELLAQACARVIDRLSAFAARHRDLACLGYTHFQPAQPTTVGKRACLWIQDLLFDLANLERARADLRFRGAKGTTGTQASFLALFAGDHTKVEELDRRITAAFGFPSAFLVTGQTYTRKLDSQVVLALASLGASAHRIGTDLRLLAHEGEVVEPSEPEQVGSSAMAYKRNPMRAERACALGRHLMALAGDALHTHATQWLERSLDDSANRRIAIPEAFLAADAVLRLLQNIAEGLEVRPALCRRHLLAELPFLATEEILMAMVEAGANRQEAHERIRQLARQAQARIAAEGADNDLLERIRRDPYFAPVHGRLDALLVPERFIGRAPAQVDRFLAEEVAPALARYRECLAESAELRV